MAIPQTDASRAMAAQIAGNSFSVTGGMDRTKFDEELPKVKTRLETYAGKGDLPAYCMLQLLKSEDRQVIVRAVASACAHLVGDSTNFTGSTIPPVKLTGYEGLFVAGVDLNANVTTNFAGAADVTGKEWAKVSNFDEMEVAYYFGVVCHAMCKTPNDGPPMDAFNAKRADAATQGLIKPAKIFVQDSEWLSYATLRKVHVSFNAYGACRANIIGRVLAHKDDADNDQAGMFFKAFALLSDFGITNLAIIKNAIIRYPQITNYPGMEIQVRAAAEAFKVIEKLPADKRSFAKAMYMDRLVFVDPNEIKNLLGVCKEYLKPTHKTYQNYKGGEITPDQRRMVAADLGVKLVEEEEKVVEQPAGPE